MSKYQFDCSACKAKFDWINHITSRSYRLCDECYELIPNYIPETQWEKYYHEKIKST